MIKVFKIKNLEFKFAPLYYRRITFKLNRDTKTFNYCVAIATINILYGKKLYQPCISLLSLMINEMETISIELYEQNKISQKANCYLHLYEFFLFIQVFIFIKLGKFDRALLELQKFTGDINEYNYFLYRILKGLCYSHCYYYDLAIMQYSEALQCCENLINDHKEEKNTNEVEKKMEKKHKKEEKFPEGDLNIL
jgi:hypothetical protein